MPEPPAPDYRSATAGSDFDPSRPLRLTLRANAVFTVLSACLLFAGATWIDDALETGHPGWIRLVGAGLAVFAVDVVLVSRATTARLLTGALFIGAADLAWVAASAVTAMLGWYEPAGLILVLGVAVVVGGFAVAELRAVRSVRQAGVSVAAGAGGHDRRVGVSS